MNKLMIITFLALCVFNVKADESCIQTIQVGNVKYRGSGMTKITGDVNCYTSKKDGTPYVVFSNSPGIIAGTALNLLGQQSDLTGLCLAIGLKGPGTAVYRDLRSKHGGKWTVVIFDSNGALTNSSVVTQDKDAAIIDSLGCNY